MATEYQTVSLADYSLGINLNKSAKQLDPRELTEALNWKYSDYGKLVTREGVQAVTAAAAPVSGYSTFITYVPGDTAYIYSIVKAGSDYKLYRLTGTEPDLAYGTSLGTLAGEATIIPYNGYGIVLDGSYIKSVTGTTLALTYDDGDSESGFQYTNHCGEHDTSTNLYSGSVEMCGASVTTQSWDSGYTIPLTQIEAWLSKTGSPTGDITAYMYDSTGATLLATSSETVLASSLTTNGTKRKFAFDLDATYSMAATTTYLFVIGYEDGDSSNYVTLYASSVASGGNQYQNSGSWSAVGTKDPLIAVKPGRPPKGSYGDVKDTRLFVSGDPDNPGYVWFSNTGSMLDWCTIDGGGWVGAVDDNANNYEVGAIVAHFGDLYVFGKKEQPFLCKLTGSIPSEFALPPLFQHVSTNHKCINSVVNDVWFASGDSINALSGVQEYGDVRAFNAGDPVKNKVASYFDETSFAGYNAADAQLLLKMTGYDNILVCHTKLLIEKNGKKQAPWTQYKLKDLTPSTFASFNNKFYIGCTDGNIYVLNTSLVKDAETLPDYTLSSGVLELPFGRAAYKAVYAQADSVSWSQDYVTDISFNSGGTINSVSSSFQTSSLTTGVKLRVSGSTSNNGEFTVVSSTTSAITVSESVTTEAAGEPICISLDYGSLSLYKNGSATAVVTKDIKANDSPRRQQIRVNTESLQWSVHSLTLSNPLRFTGLSLLGRSLGTNI